MSWIQGFLDAAKRRGLSPRTIESYAEILQRITNHQKLDLETCSQQELFAFLDKTREKNSLGYYRLSVILTKMSLKFLKRKDLAEAIEFPKQRDPAASIKVLPPEEVEKLIREAPRLQDRLIVELLYESGARRGELANLAIRDIQFDEYGAILWLNGKTGTRRRRVYSCVADLREHINNHPLRDKPNAPLFFNPRGGPYTHDSLYRCVRRLGKRILGKGIYPHQFRHTRATEDSRHFTDREMMKLFGWKGPQMVGIYSHLSMRDVEDKDLVLHGLKPREEVLRPLVEAQFCPKCNQENAPIAVYCVKCGAILPNQHLAGLDKIMAEPDFIKRLINSESFKEALRKALGE
jgi:integrase